MKFAVAFVVGETELIDTVADICGTKFICRHCNCPTDNLVNVEAQATTRLWIPEAFATPVREIDCNHWKNLSHHPIKNIFDCINLVATPIKYILQHLENAYICINLELQKAHLRF